MCGYVPGRRDGFLAFAPGLIAGEPSDADYQYAELFAAEPSHFWFRARNRLVVWALQRYFPHATSFLEIGCGTGFVLSGIEQANPQLRVAGSEIHLVALPFARRRTRGELFQMDARQIPFFAEYDVVGAFDVLEHVAEDEAVLAQVFQATRPGGGILLTVPQHRWLWSVLDDVSGHQRRYRRTDLTGKLERAGFEVLRATSFVSLLLPLLLVVRLTKRQPSESFDVLSEFRVSGTLNRLLELILDWERWLLVRGLSFPLGGSLLVVARKPGGATEEPR